MNRRPRIGISNADLVLVEWVDSSRPEGWHSSSDLLHPVNECVSVGWLVESTKEVVRVVPHTALNHRGEYDQFLGTVTIPRVAVVRIRTIWKAWQK